MTTFLTRNWGAKLVSLVLAVGLWYYAVGEEKVEVTRTIPIELKMEEEKLSVVGKPIRVVSVTLQAPRSLLTNLATEELKAVHWIKNVKAAGDYNFRVEPREIGLPSEEIRVVRIDPEVVQVKIDEMIVQKLEVEPVFLGETAIGYRVDPAKIQLDPSSVLVEGPKGQLGNLRKTKTQPIDMVGRVRSFRKTVRIAEIPGLKFLSESLVDVYVPIEEALGEKSFEGIPVKILGTPASLARINVEPGKINTALQGSDKDLEAIDPARLLFYVEVSGLEEGTHQVPIQAVLPVGIYLKENLPTAKVTLQKKGGGIPLIS